MASFQLDDIRAAAEAKYGSYDIMDGDNVLVSLLNPLKLDKQRREELAALQEEFSSEDTEIEQEEYFARVIRLVADSKRGADALLRMVGKDLTVLATILTQYREHTQVGEASDSQS